MTVEEGNKIIAEGSMPIFFKNMGLKWSDLLFIMGKVIHNNEIVCMKMLPTLDEVEASFFHKKETAYEIAKRDAVDTTMRSLRNGIKIIFLDGVDSINIIRKVSPPLYNRFYSQTPQQ